MERQTSPMVLLALGIGGVVLCPLLGPVVIYLADIERKRAVVDGVTPETRVLIARILGYVGTALLCLDVLALMLAGLWFAFTGGTFTAG